MNDMTGVFQHDTISPEFPSLQQRQPPLQRGEQTGWQSIITSSWVLRWAAMPSTYATYRTIRKHPTVALARALAVAPVLAAEWSIKAKDGAPKEWVELIQDTFFPLREKYLEAALFYGNIDFGYQGFEKIFEDVDGYTRLTRIKPLLHDITEICIGQKGEFIGFRQWGTELGILNAVHIGFRVEGSYLYGIPLMENIRETWNDWHECNAGAKRYDKHVAGAHWIVHYPDRMVTHNGIQRPAGEVARALLANLESGGGAAIPRDVAEWMSQLGTNDPGWKIELISAGTSEQGNFVDRLNYLDKLLCRGLLLPERSVLEGTHGTKEEAETHLDVAMVTKDLEHRYCTAELNRQAVDEVLVVNFGPQAKGMVELEASPIVDSKREFFKELYKTVLDNPQAAVEEFAKMDLDAMRDALGIPKAKETDKPEQGEGDDPRDRRPPQPPRSPTGLANVLRLDAKPDSSGGRWVFRGIYLANGDKLPEGSTKNVNGRGYVLQGGRWHRERGGDTPEHKPIEITGTEDGVDWSDPGTREAMLPRLMGQFAGNPPYINAETKTPIKVSKRGLEKILSHLPDAKPAMVLAKLPEVLEKMAWTHDAIQDPPKQGVKMWHYFHADIVLAGVPHDAEIKVREDVNGNWFYDQHIKIT